jgi:hypothetical protein
MAYPMMIGKTNTFIKLIRTLVTPINPNITNIPKIKGINDTTTAWRFL